MQRSQGVLSTTSRRDEIRAMDDEPAIDVSEGDVGFVILSLLVSEDRGLGYLVQLPNTSHT